MPTQNAPRRLTEGYIKSPTYKTRAFAVRDTTVRGLLIDVNKLSKSYKVQKELWVGERGRRRLAKTVRKTLGTTEDLTLDEPRDRSSVHRDGGATGGRLGAATAHSTLNDDGPEVAGRRR